MFPIVSFFHTSLKNNSGEGGVARGDIFVGIKYSSPQWRCVIQSKVFSDCGKERNPVKFMNSYK